MQTSAQFERNKLLTGFILLVVLGIFLRFSTICFDSLWLDESYQSLIGACGHGPARLESSDRFLFRFERPAALAQTLERFRTVDPLCPPLYALALNCWISIFGQSDFAIRSLSAFISSLTLVCLAVFSRLFLGGRSWTWALALAALSPFDVHYAQEARMYSLVVLSSILSTGSLLLFLKWEPSRKNALVLLPLYSVSTFALANSHYTALFLIAVQAAAASLLLIQRRDFLKFALLLLAWACTFILSLPFLSMFLQAAQARSQSFYVARSPDLIWPLKAFFLRIPVNLLVFLSGVRVAAYACPLYVTAFLMIAASAAGAFLSRDAERWSLRALWIWALAPAMLLFFVDVLENHRVIEMARYLIFTAPAVYLLAGWGQTSFFARRKLFALVGIVHVVFAGINLAYTHSVKQREPWREMAAAVEKLVPDNEVLAVSQYYNIICLDRYLSRPRLQLGLSPAMGKKAVARKLSGLEKFALLTAQEGEAIKGMLEPDFKMEAQVDMPHGLHLRLYSRRLPAS